MKSQRLHKFKTTFSVGLLLLVVGCANSPYLDIQANQVTQSMNDGGIQTPKVVSSAQNLSDALSRVAATSAATGDFSTAARLYRRAHKIAPKSLMSALGLARSTQAIGDHRSSIAAFQTVLQIQPDHLQAHEQIGRQFMALGSAKDALPHLRAAVEQRPDAGHHNELGIAHDLMGDHDAAQKVYRTALELAPGDLALRTNLGRSLAFSGHYQESITTLQALAYRPTATKRHREALALALAAAGDVRAALNVTRSDEIGKNEANRRAHYAMIGELARQGEPGARAQLVAGTVQREIYAEETRQSRANLPTRTPKNELKKPNILAVLAGIDARENQRKIAEPASKTRAEAETGSKSLEIATNTARKPNFETQSIAPNSLSFAPSDQEQHDYPRSEVPKSAITEQDYNSQPNLAETGPVGIFETIYRVQLAAYYSKERSEKGWRQLVLMAPDVLNGIDHVVIPPRSGNTLFKLRTQAYMVRKEARSLCEDVKFNNLECIVVKTVQPHRKPSLRNPLLISMEAIS